ncbi:protein-lysine N-methyltransferase EEF2KMT-like isoform X1 [Branchiostoma floridae]|uniref:Protein-lysine N-methyltransferase EEF2KMT-like isoform X1 n=1 Tax=Branchiostoma floridae TaxID=7739 RepID=A0A9J7M656_BRAFL|nr:protein-lysine N-methyltransferase EEF2KMT-like isoform X1 [Branchiostoma floridae]
MAATPAVADDGREERPTLRLVQAQFMAMVPLRFFRWKLPIEQVQPPTPSQARTLLHHVSLPNCWGVRTSVLDGEDKGKAVFELEDQQELLQMTVHHPLIMRYPTSLSYRQAFLKHIIQQCEDAGQEVCDELYEVYTSLLVSTLEPTSPCCYKTYTLPCGKTVVLREATQIISHGTTGLRTWEAGLCLAEWAVEHSALFEQKTVLELGSGMGLTGLVISSCCSPAHYIYSDCHPNVLANLWENLVLNCKLREEGGGSVNGKQGCTAVKQKSTHGGAYHSEHARNNTEAVVVNYSTDPVEDKGDEREQTCNRCQHNSDTNLSCQENASEVLPETELQSCTNTAVFRFGKSDANMENVSWYTGNHPWETRLVQGSKMSVMCLDWASVTQEELQSLAPDVIIASDVVFDNELVEYFVSLLLKAMHPPPGGRSGPVAYVASTIRNQDTYDFYVRKLEEAGICSEDLSLGSTAVFFYDRQQTMKIHKLWISDEIR